MTSEYRASELEEQEAIEEPRDRTKWLWVGVAAIVAVMVALLWVYERPSNLMSTARVKHILIQANMGDPVERNKALTTAKELRERILKGESFEKLAREYSNDPWSSPRGGDLGYARRGTYEDPFEAYVWNPNTKINEVGDIVRTSRGFHIIVVVDRRLSPEDKYDQDVLQRAQKPASAANTP